MNYGEAKNILDKTFNQENFNEKNFKEFIYQLFAKNINIHDRPQSIDQQYQSHISSCKIIGDFVDSNKCEVIFLIVNLSSEKSLDRARTLQRNFIAEILQNSFKQYAIVAFVGGNQDNWRFSLVKLEYNLITTRDNKLNSKKELSPSKRLSFLVGKNEGSHTVKSQFQKILNNEKQNIAPTIAEIEKAFNIEAITDEFFEKYKELDKRLREALEDLRKEDEKIKNDFIDKQISDADFAKKTLGQIVFLYFLQKKGWFGVKNDEAWGSGDKNFLRHLFNQQNQANQNFFNDVLKHVFYEALATDRGLNAIYTKLDCRMPFLNGGLFEPMNGYAWETTKINIPNQIFSNQNKTKEGDTGDGIFDIFDRYNFTVNENEPLEQEVAVDPEMLGKVFENLLEIKDRKSKGAFYTPREIVHYMCQESLINYLHTQTNLPIEPLSNFIKNKSLENIENSASKIDKLLANVKVCDPAVGSGAFMLGMLNEIVNARLQLDKILLKNSKEYDLKLHAISNSIYGVDLDSGAVEIAKLRLWLALVVEEEIPFALPNLDHKIMQGNSLLEEYEGIKLFDDEVLNENNKIENQESLIKKKLEIINKELILEAQNNKAKSQNPQYLAKLKEQSAFTKTLKTLKSYDQLGQIKEETKALTLSFIDNENSAKNILLEKFYQLQKFIKNFFTENSRTQKLDLKKQIDEIKWQLIEATLIAQKKQDKLVEIQNLRRKNIHPFFIWKLEFCDVFSGENPGFDIVIGNPPYICENKEVFKMLKNSQYYMGKANIWYFFGCVGLDLLKKDGIQAYIAPNNWTSNFGAKLLRKKTLEESKILEFIDFEDYKVFENADIQTMIYIIQKCIPNNQYKVKHSKLVNKNINKIELELFLQFPYGTNDSRFTKEILNFEKQKFLNKNINFLKQETNFIINKISSGNKTFLTYDEVAQGIVIPQDLIIKKHLSLVDNKIKKGDGIFVLSNKEKEDLNLDKNEIELLKPYFITKNFYKFGANYKNNYWIIYTDSKFKDPKEIKNFPNLKKHLDQFKDIVTSDNKPYGLHRSRDEKFFKGQKIIVTRKCIEPQFSLCDFDSYVSSTFNIIKTDRFNLKFLVAILNSKVIKFWLKNKGKMQGTNFQIDNEPILNIPIINLSNISQTPFIDIVDEILSITNQTNYNPDFPPLYQKELEAKIDEMVCDLYQLDDEEKKLILGEKSVL